MFAGVSSSSRATICLEIIKDRGRLVKKNRGAGNMRTDTTDRVTSLADAVGC